MNRSRLPLTGALAGVVSVVAFAWIHAILISDIWFSLVPMVVAGAFCGVCVAGTFAILVDAPTLRRWLLYNATHVGLFVVLGILSILVYEPVTTIPALLTRGEPPAELFRQVVLLNVAFTVGATVLITVLFGRRWWHLAPVLLTQTVLVLFLGHNVAILGLVELSMSTAYLVVELFGLIVAIVGIYAVVVAALERRAIRSRTAVS